MNWSRAKTILIVVFLVVDAFLFYQTYTGKIGNRVVTDKRSIDQIVDYLGKQDINIKSSIPTKDISSPLLTVKYKYFDKGDALDIFFDSRDDAVFEKGKDKYIIRDSNITFQMKNNGESLYTNKNKVLKNGERLDQNIAEKNIERFLKKLKIVDSEIFTVKKEVKDDCIKVEYYQGIKNMFIDNTILEIEATNKGITYMKMLWFESIIMGKTKKEVIPAIKALIKLSEVFRDIDNTVIVEDISQGYYFNLDIENVKEFDIKAIEEGTAIPVWKVKTNMGYIYINAYNGTVEKN